MLKSQPNLKVYFKVFITRGRWFNAASTINKIQKDSDSKVTPLFFHQLVLSLPVFSINYYFYG